MPVPMPLNLTVEGHRVWVTNADVRLWLRRVLAGEPADPPPVSEVLHFRIHNLPPSP